MQYRNGMNKDLSLLGFGCMRLPVDKTGEIDEALAIKMIRSGIDAGINYVDTAYMYHDGKSEVVVGKALKDGYREKVWLADKLAVWYAKSKAGLYDIFSEQLKRLDDDYIDLYLMHNVDENVWKTVLEFDAISVLEDLKNKGKIGHIGFSFHGSSFEFFKEVLDYTDAWEFVQIQLNYMDTEFQAGLKGLKYAASKGLPVVIMEPLKGGKLVDKLPPSVEQFFDKIGDDKTPAERAFKWLANFPEVLTILSGMSTPSQLEENLKILSEAEANSLGENELTLIEMAAKEYNKLAKYGCTGCKYCLPCSVKINIPDMMYYINQYAMFAQNEKIISEFQMFTNPKRGPSTCIHCKKCEEKCPQHLKIMQAMDEAKGIFGR